MLIEKINKHKSTLRERRTTVLRSLSLKMNLIIKLNKGCIGLLYKKIDYFKTNILKPRKDLIKRKERMKMKWDRKVSWFERQQYREQIYLLNIKEETNKRMNKAIAKIMQKWIKLKEVIEKAERQQRSKMEIKLETWRKRGRDQTFKKN